MIMRIMACRLDKANGMPTQGKAWDTKMTAPARNFALKPTEFEI
jgi:hypothetical protein